MTDMTRPGMGADPGKETGYDPAQGSPTVAPTGGTEHEGTQVRATSPGGVTTERGYESTPLFPHDTSDELELKLQHAVTGFVDAPRASVEEADHVLEEVAGLISEVLTERRRTLRRSWESTDTEQLRLALRDYRELAERLLHV